MYVTWKFCSGPQGENTNSGTDRVASFQLGFSSGSFALAMLALLAQMGEIVDRFPVFVPLGFLFCRQNFSHANKSAGEFLEV